jgi:hypothetical protein
VSAHKAQQIALPQKADLAGFLSLGGGFIFASGNYGSNAQWAARLDHPQNQRSTVAATDGELHPPSPHDEHASRRLSLGEQNRACGVRGGDGFLLQSVGYGWRETAKGFVR